MQREARHLDWASGGLWRSFSLDSRILKHSKFAVRGYTWRLGRRWLNGTWIILSGDEVARRQISAAMCHYGGQIPASLASMEGDRGERERGAKDFILPISHRFFFSIFWSSGTSCQSTDHHCEAPPVRDTVLCLDLVIPNII